jgi:hypothetical protein
MCGPALHNQKVALRQPFARDQFKRNRKHPKIKGSLMAERLARKPAAEVASTVCAMHFGAGR